MVTNVAVIERARTLDEMDPFYRKYATMKKPFELTCSCGWLGDKPKIIRFKKAPLQKLCPDCGHQTVNENADFTFWRTAQDMKPGMMLTEIGFQKIKAELDKDRTIHLPYWTKEIKDLRDYGIKKNDPLMSEAINKRDFYQSQIVILEDMISKAVLVLA
jgi:hypothetical protein